jgi:hypothetical protein
MLLPTSHNLTAAHLGWRERQSPSGRADGRPTPRATSLRVPCGRSGVAPGDGTQLAYRPSGRRERARPERYRWVCPARL